MKIDVRHIEILRNRGLVVSAAFPSMHVSYPDGVVVGKLEGVGGNQLPGYKCQWGMNGPNLDSPTVNFFAKDNHSWFVTVEEYMPGLGPGDFVHEWASVDEALADILDYFFGNPDRMNAGSRGEF